MRNNLIKNIFTYILKIKKILGVLYKQFSQNYNLGRTGRNNEEFTKSYTYLVCS